MGEMKTTIYTAIARRDEQEIRFLLKDPAGHIVAEGTGDTLSAAQQDACGKAAHESAKKHLQQVKYPDSLAD